MAHEQNIFGSENLTEQLRAVRAARTVAMLAAAGRRPLPSPAPNLASLQKRELELLVRLDMVGVRPEEVMA